MKKRIISFNQPLSILNAMTRCLDAYLNSTSLAETRDTYTSRASVFAPVKKAIRPDAKFRLWLEAIALQHESSIEKLSASVTTTEFWNHPDFPHSNYTPPLSFDATTPSLADLSLVAYLSNRIDTLTFEALQQIHIFKREFELDASGKIARPSDYSCMIPVSREHEIITISHATPEITHQGFYTINHSASIVHSLVGREDDAAQRIAEVAFKAHTKIPMDSSFIKTDGSLDFSGLKSAILEAIHTTPEALRFIVTAPDSRPSHDRQEWFSLLFTTQYFWTHATILEQPTLNNCLSIPLVRSITAALHPKTTYLPHLTYGPFGLERLKETELLNLHPVGLLHPNLKSNPYMPHELNDGGAMLMAHDIGFHIPWLASRPIHTTQIFLNVFPQLFSEALKTCKQLHGSNHVISSIQKLHNSSIELLYDVEENIASEGTYVTSQLQFILNTANNSIIDTEPPNLILDLSAYFIFSLVLAAHLSSLNPSHFSKLDASTQHLLSQAQADTLSFTSRQLDKIHKEFYFTFLRYSHDPDKLLEPYCALISDTLDTLIETKDYLSAASNIVNLTNILLHSKESLELQSMTPLPHLTTTQHRIPKASRTVSTTYSS